MIPLNGRNSRRELSRKVIPRRKTGFFVLFLRPHLLLHPLLLVNNRLTMSFVPGQPVTAVVERIEIQKLSQGPNLVLGFCIGGGIDQDPGQNPFSDDKADKGIYVTRVSPGGPADVAGLKIGDKIMQVNGWDMTVVTHDQARKKLTKKNEHVVRLLVTRKTLEEAVKQSMSRPGPS